MWMWRITLSIWSNLSPQFELILHLGSIWSSASQETPGRCHCLAFKIISLTKLWIKRSRLNLRPWLKRKSRILMLLRLKDKWPANDKPSQFSSNKIFLQKIRPIIFQETTSHHNSLIISRSKDNMDKRMHREKINEAKTKIWHKTISSVYYSKMLQVKMKETKVKTSPKTMSCLQSNRLSITQSQTSQILPM